MSNNQKSGAKKPSYIVIVSVFVVVVVSIAISLFVCANRCGDKPETEKSQTAVPAKKANVKPRGNDNAVTALPRQNLTEQADVAMEDVGEEAEDEGVRLVREWENFVDSVVTDDAGEITPEMQKLVAENFSRLQDEDKLVGLSTMLNLLPDSRFALLEPMLLDVKQPQDVLDVIFDDLLNRDEELKMPLMKKIRDDKIHPLNESCDTLLSAIED